MNWDQIEGNWKQVKGKAKELWGKLTDEELDSVAGKGDQLGALASAADADRAAMPRRDDEDDG